MNKLIGQAIDEQKRILNVGNEDTKANGGEVIDLDIPFDVVDDLLRGETNPNSIEKIVDGTAELTENLTQDEWDLMDALVAESGAIQMIERYVDRTSSQQSISNKDTSSLMMCTDGGFSAKVLSELMWLQVENEISSQVADETQYLSNVSTLFSVSSIMLMKSTGGV